MTAKRPLLGEPSAHALADTFRVLGDVTRVRILDAISRSELCVTDIAAIVGLSESAVSHQLRLLRGTRLVRPRRDGRRVFYTLDDQHIVGLFEQGLEHVQERNGAPAPIATLRSVDAPPRSPRTASPDETTGVVPGTAAGRLAEGRSGPPRRRSRRESRGA